MMNTKPLILVFFAFLLANTSIQAQKAFSQEAGVILGPIQFRGDYGLAGESETNYGNLGFGFGVVHYINFAYNQRRGSYVRASEYLKDHFKIRSEINFFTAKLNHFGKIKDDQIADPTQANTLDEMEGDARVFEIGTGFEYFPLSIVDFELGYTRFAPYAGFNVHYATYNSNSSSSLGDLDIAQQEGDEDILFGTFIGGLDNTGGSTYSLVFNAGTRYRIGETSDLLIDFRFIYYGTDLLDGLEPVGPQNQDNDWITWLNVGYIYYFDL
ncbi:THC0290_0291 family protein [Gangjinia marincola]